MDYICTVPKRDPCVECCNQNNDVCLKFYSPKQSNALDCPQTLHHRRRRPIKAAGPHETPQLLTWDNLVHYHTKSSIVTFFPPCRLCKIKCPLYQGVSDETLLLPTKRHDNLATGSPLAGRIRLSGLLQHSSRRMFSTAQQVTRDELHTLPVPPSHFSAIWCMPKRRCVLLNMSRGCVSRFDRRHGKGHGLGRWNS